jgi:amidase
VTGPAELGWLDATDQARLVAAREVSPPELVDAAIERVQQLDPQLNAVIHPRFEKARAEAAAASLPDGPFRGVPILLKDLGCVSEGDPDHQGNRLLAELANTAPADANLTALLRKAGFVVIGRTNVPEFGLVSTTESSAYGATRNPWDTTRSPGGSSGGSSATVASGIVAVAQGTDGGGSLRIPASHCGIFALKPSRGRVSTGPYEGDVLAGCNVYGVMSRTVRDSALVLDQVAGWQVGDAVVAPPPPRSFAEEVGRDPGTLRIGVMVVDEVNGYAVAESINDAVRTAAKLLESLGHQVDVSYPAAMTDPAYLDYFVDLLSPSVAALMAQLESRAGRPLRPEDAEEITWHWHERGRTISAAQHVANESWRDDFRRRMASWWADGFDVLLSPVMPTPPPPLGHFKGPDGVRRSIDILCFTPQFNLTGQPAASVPIAVTDEGWPVGVQIAGTYGAEGVLIRLASQIEEAAPWTGRRPTVSA